MGLKTILLSNKQCHRRMLLSVGIVLALSILCQPILEPARAVEVDGIVEHRDVDQFYEIDFDGGRSHLSFPVRHRFVGLGFSSRQDFSSPSASNIVFAWNLKYRTALSGSAETARDYDYLDDSTDLSLVGTTHDGVDISSNMESTLETGHLAELSGGLRLFDEQPGSVRLMGGLKYMFYEVQNTDLDQTGHGPYSSGYTTSVSGPIIDYQRETFFPFVGLNFEWQLLEGLALNTRGLYSPNVSVSDKDDHLLRRKLSKGDFTGDGYEGTLELRSKPIQHLQISVGGSYLHYQATGHQDQRWYGDDPATGIDETGNEINGIPNRVESDEVSYHLKAGYRF